MQKVNYDHEQHSGLPFLNGEGKRKHFVKVKINTTDPKQQINVYCNCFAEASYSGLKAILQSVVCVVNTTEI